MRTTFQIRAASGHGSRLPGSSLELMFDCDIVNHCLITIHRSTLARAHALLCDRDTVTPADALVAIVVVEDSITARTGASVMHFRPEATSGRCNLDMHGAASYAGRMPHLAKQVNKVCMHA